MRHRLAPRRSRRNPRGPSTTAPSETAHRRIRHRRRSRLRTVPAEAALARRPRPAAARVCTDLARVLDAGDVHGAATRAADVCSSAGRDRVGRRRAGAALVPDAVTHGYSPALLARMHAIPRPTPTTPAAAAWRTGDRAHVAARATIAGALVTPIITAEGASACWRPRLRHGAERREDVRAAGRNLLRSTRNGRDDAAGGDKPTRSSDAESWSAELPKFGSGRAGLRSASDSAFRTSRTAHFVPHFEFAIPNWLRWSCRLLRFGFASSVAVAVRAFLSRV